MKVRTNIKAGSADQRPRQRLDLESQLSPGPPIDSCALDKAIKPEYTSRALLVQLTL
ncbi:MAG: hypothetical protein ACR2IV_21340 [Bryobacteraceae bacterium]